MVRIETGIPLKEPLYGSLKGTQIDPLKEPLTDPLRVPESTQCTLGSKELVYNVQEGSGW